MSTAAKTRVVGESVPRKEGVDKLLGRAENFIANGATTEAKDILTQIVEKFPDTNAAKTAKEKVAQIR